MESLLAATDRCELERVLGGTLRAVAEIRRGMRATVVRCTLDGSAERGEVIVKLPSASGSLLHHERAGLEALQGLAVPRLLTALPSGALVLEDLGGGPTLENWLDGSDPLVESVLLRAAAALGALHASARARIAHFERLDAERAQAYRAQARQLTLAQESMASVFSAAGVHVPPSFQRCCERLATMLTAVSELFTITPGDLAPSNVMAPAEGPITFLDLEYCGVRHAFYDAMFWRCICPFPDVVADGMERAYLDAWRAHGVVLDPERCAREMVQLATHRLLWMLSWNMIALFRADQDWARPGLSARGFLIRYLEDYTRFAASRPHDPVLLTALAELGHALRLRWPNAHAEPFAAFRHSGYSKRTT